MGRNSRRVGRLLACLLACVVALCAAPGKARATEIIEQDAFGEGGSLTWTLYDTGELVIEGTGKMPDYNPVQPTPGSPAYTDSPWAEHSRDVKSVTVADGVTSVGNYAFYYMPSLASVDLEEGVESIGDYAFCDCGALTSVDLLSTLESIGASAFSGCDALSSVTLPVGLKGIGKAAFRWCESLSSVTFEGEAAPTIDSRAFLDCDSLASIYVPYGAEGYEEKLSGYAVKIAHVAGDFAVTGGVAGTDYEYENGVLTIMGENPVTVSMAAGATSTTNRIVVNAGDGTAHVTLDGVGIDVSASMDTAAMLVEGGSLELTLAGESSLRSGMNCAGLQNGENRLAIGGDGSLEARGGMGGAGIGGGFEGAGSDIAISGGTVNAEGDGGAAGIGGGNKGAGSDITISGGTVNATGGGNGAGIGGGVGSAGSNITISDGAVTATGGGNGAGIGGGDGGAGSDIAVEGGTVTATGKTYATGIGGGYMGTASGIVVSGGLVSAEGGEYGGSAIGNGPGATDDASVTITGGAFADTPIDEGVTRNAVYGVELGEGHVAAANVVEDEADEYPVRVYGLPTFVDPFADGAVTKAYDGEPLSVDLSRCTATSPRPTPGSSTAPTASRAPRGPRGPRPRPARTT